MKKERISRKILAKIKEQKIRPKPKWQFLLNNYLFWIIGIICLIIGAVSVSAVIFQFANGDWDVLGLLGNRALGFFFLSLPYFWLGMVILFLVFGYYGITKTKIGYRYQKTALVVGLIIITGFLGSSLQAFDLGQSVDKKFRRNCPFYQRMNKERGQRWQRPESGMLAGRIEALSRKTMEVRDFKGNIWQIDISQAKMPFGNFSQNNQVRIIGEKTEDKKIKAKAVLPWQRGPSQHLGVRFVK
jgi:uncharacterized membrane protein